MNLQEYIAAFCHDYQWTGWMRYLLNKCNLLPDGSYIIPHDLAERWKRQMATNYINLSEEEKESDRKEARSILRLVATCLVNEADKGEGS